MDSYQQDKIVDELTSNFSYETASLIKEIRERGQDFCNFLYSSLPPGREAQAAQERMNEAIMWAAASAMKQGT